MLKYSFKHFQNFEHGFVIFLQMGMVNFSTRLLLCQIIQNGQTKYCIMPEMKVSYVFNLIIFSENPPKSNGRNEDSSDLLKNSSPGIYKALVSKVCNNISLFVLYIIERMPLDLHWILKTPCKFHQQINYPIIHSRHLPQEHTLSRYKVRMGRII